ncbi:MAG: glutaredoxin domain-containing protein [Nanoarchaeota archaeon]
MKKEHDIIIYRTRNCIWCHKAAELFKQHNIKFKEIYVDKDYKAAQEMIKKSGQIGVPVIDINGKIIVGYDLEAFKKLLGI